MDPRSSSATPFGNADDSGTSDRLGWIEQQQQILDTEMRALWFSGGFTLLGLCIAAILIYLNRI